MRLSDWGGTGANIDNMVKAIKSYNYNAEMNGFNEAKAESNLHAGRLVILLGESNAGHAYVLDGFGSVYTDSWFELWTFPDVRWFRRVDVIHNQTYSQKSYHINWGWGGQNNGNYVDFSKLVTDIGTFKTNKMIYNIYPKK